MRNISVVEAVKDPLLLASRVLMMLLFIVFGSQKVLGYSETTMYFAHQGVPLPAIATSVAIMMELGVGTAIVLGLFTRPLAILLAAYTLATAMIGHAFWTMSGPDRLEAEINFFKNVSIMSGLFVLFVTGAGRFSLDGKWAGQLAATPAKRVVR